MVVTFLALILLPSRTVLVSCVGLLPWYLALAHGSDDMGHFWGSFSELLIFSEQRAGQRLLSEKVTGPHVRANRPILVPSVPVSEGIEIRHGCQFISSLVGALRVGFCHVVLALTCQG